MQQLAIGNNQYQLPGSWAEISPSQYKRVGTYLHADSNECRAGALLRLFRGKRRLRLSRDLEAVGSQEGIESNVLWQILSMLDFMFQRERVQARSEVHPTLASFRHRGTTYLLPQHSLNDMTIGEWADVQARFAQYEQTKLPEHLMQVVASICRPSKPAKVRRSAEYDGYPRIAFNPETVQRRARKLEGVGPHVIHAVFDYLMRAAELLRKRYGIMFEGPRKTGGPNFGWYGQILSVAEAGVFGDEDKVKRMLIHRVCLYTCKKILDQKQRQDD